MQDLTYVTVDHSWPQPINVPNENLDVQYTGVKFDTSTGHDPIFNEDAVLVCVLCVGMQCHP